MSGGLGGAGLKTPMQGTVVKIAVTEGQSVEAGELVVILEAMKMEQPLVAHRSGVIKNLKSSLGQVLPTGTTICEIE
jgi:acetyl-CoA/propionyl-CoA carboxylase biotin carboxyl carrier protein